MLRRQTPSTVRRCSNVVGWGQMDRRRELVRQGLFRRVGRWDFRCRRGRCRLSAASWVHALRAADVRAGACVCGEAKGLIENRRGEPGGGEGARGRGSNLD